MASLKKHIEQHCKNCTYDKLVEGTWRAQVEACSAKTCALWPVRPMTMETVNQNRHSGKVIPIRTQEQILEDLEDEDQDEPEAAAA